MNPFSTLYDFNELTAQADALRRARFGKNTFYVLNRHINPTNVCRLRCPLCAFSCDSTDSRAYAMTLDEIVKQAQIASESGCTEVHLVSAIYPSWGFEQFYEMVRQIHLTFPALHIKAFTAIEIAWMATQMISGSETGLQSVDYNSPAFISSVKNVLNKLKSAGLESMPGGGAEILNDEIRAIACPKKGSAGLWLKVHQIAHELKIPTTATMLFGMMETPEHRLEHVEKIQKLQEQTGGFVAFIPLVFHPRGTQFAHLPAPGSFEKLRVIAASRVALNSVAHIKAYWVSLGLEIAQVALSCGADDMDGTVCKERIHHDSGATTPVGMTETELKTLIRRAGFAPVERDSIYGSFTQR